MRLPHLLQLLHWLTPTTTLTGHSENLSPLHERAHALALGWPDTDGLLPWAAWAAQTQPDLAATMRPENAWAYITPCHWQAQADHVTMLDPAQLSWAAGESLAFMQTMQNYCNDDGITLHWLNDSTWLAEGAVFQHLPTASLERVRNAPIDRWMPRQPQAKALRRLQNEMQMLLYTHPLNQERSAHQRTPINSFWISGTGALAGHTHGTPACTLVTALQKAGANDDAPSWQQAWHDLDSGLLAQALQRVRAGHSMQLTLCGNTHAQSFALQAPSLWQRIQRRFQNTPTKTWLSTL